MNTEYLKVQDWLINRPDSNLQLNSVTFGNCLKLTAWDLGRDNKFLKNLAAETNLLHFS